jgi:DNA-binding transcriptional LysR family regulator
MLNLAQLNTFCKVVELKSFSRAAEVLAISQPAVSNQIKALEAFFEAKLLCRGGTEIIPTHAGTVVYKSALTFLSSIDNLKQSLAIEYKEDLSGKLALGASTSPATNLIPGLLCDFKNNHPKIDVSFMVGDSKSIVQAVLNNKIEFGIVGYLHRDQYLNFKPFVEDELILVVNAEHPWAGRDVVGLEEIQQAPLIIQQWSSGATQDLFDLLREFSLKPVDFNMFMELGLQESVKAAVKNGNGVAFLSRLGTDSELQNGTLIEVPIAGISLRRTIYCVTPKNRTLSRLAENFKNYATQCCSRNKNACS